MFTPEEESRAHSAMSIRTRDQSCFSEPTEIPQNSSLEKQQERRQTPVVIYQSDERQSQPEPVVNSISIKDRLHENSWNQQNLFEELNAFQTVTPLVQLLPDVISLRSPNTHWTNELLLEVILTKSEETPGAQNLTSLETQGHAISLAKSLVSQHKFWQASLILKGMCTGPDFVNLRSDHKIKLLKLRLLVHVGERFEEPRLIANIEANCKMLLAQETCMEEKPSLECHCPGNLISAYLFRIQGIKCRDLDPLAVSTIAMGLKKQLSLEKPPLSAAWAAQQYVRFCLRNCNYDIAEKFLNAVRRALLAIGRKDGPEADLNAHLDEMLQPWRRNSKRYSTAPEIVDVYYKFRVDYTWLEAFETYVKDEPHACPEEVRRTRDMDTEYWR